MDHATLAQDSVIVLIVHGDDSAIHLLDGHLAICRIIGYRKRSVGELSYSIYGHQILILAAEGILEVEGYYNHRNPSSYS